MKFVDYSTALTAAFALQFLVACAKHHGNAHRSALERLHNHHRISHASKVEQGHEIDLRDVEVEKRTGSCQFPIDAGLVAVTPNDANGGWAMSPDQCCEPGNYCPYACPPGQVMAQWDPDATSYTYPQSMNGGLYCDKSGAVQKPFPNKPYCVDGTGNIGCNNTAKGNVAFCQTVLPGNEAMLIPTNIETWAQLAVPGPDYWAGTAAHFYINPPGISTEEACVWGSSSNPWGNWSPYVAGANTDHSGETFIKLAWNPIYLEPATPFRNKMPTWGVEIVCDGHCNGLPCAIDPSKHQVNEIEGASTDGAGGASFCVVTVPKGTNANFVVFEGGMNVPENGSEDNQPATQKSAAPEPAYTHVAPSSSPPPPSSDQQSSTPSSTPKPTPTPTPTPTITPTPSLSPSPTSPSAQESSSSSSPPPLLTSSSVDTSTFTPPVSSSNLANSSTTALSSTTESTIALTRTETNIAHSKYEQSPTPLPAPSFSYRPHVFNGNSTATASVSSLNGASSAEPSASGNATLHGSYTGPLAAISGGTFSAHVTFAGFGVTFVAAITSLAL